MYSGNEAGRKDVSESNKAESVLKKIEKQVLGCNNEASSSRLKLENSSRLQKINRLRRLVNGGRCISDKKKGLGINFTLELRENTVKKIMYKYLFHPLLKKYQTLQGRACRKEFWFIAGFLFAAAMIFEFIFTVMTGGRPSGELTILNAAVHIALSIPLIAAGTRRLHDTNRSGWWSLIVLIPIAGYIAYIIFMCLKGTPGENRFGQNPLSPDENDRTASKNHLYSA